MEKSELILELKPIVRSVFENSELEITDDMSSETTEEWTSLSFMTLLSEIENHFGFKFKMMEVLRLKNMGDIIEAVLRHIN